MESKSVCVFLMGALVACLAMTGQAQLIGPFQACELRCQEEMKAFHDVVGSINVADICHDYCLKHAFNPNASFPTFNPPTTAKA